MLYYRYWCPEG